MKLQTTTKLTIAIIVLMVAISTINIVYTKWLHHKQSSIYTQVTKNISSTEIRESLWIGPSQINIHLGIIALLTIIGTIIVIRFSISSVTDPLKKINNQLDSIIEGNIDTILQDDSLNEINQLINKIQTLREMIITIESGHQKTYTHLKTEIKDCNYQLGHSCKEMDKLIRALTYHLHDQLNKQKLLGKQLLEIIPEPKESFTDLHKRILRCTEHMQDTLADLIQLSEATTPNLPFSTIDPQQIIEELKNDNQLLIRHTKAKIITTNMLPFPGDHAQIKVMFQNLLTNSMKFSRKGVVPLIKISSQKVILENNDEMIQYSIEDNGIGINPIHKDMVFDLFFKINRDNDGNGMGLPIVKQIVTHHRGTISIDSNGTNKTTVNIYFPV